MKKLIPVILSGGVGSRLWPVSREGHPKPFMKLADGQTLLEKTYRRAAQLPGVIKENGRAMLLTVTNQNHYFISRDELNKAGATGVFLLEPFGRNTAPAIAMAAHQVLSHFGDQALMLVLSADHLIQDEAAFTQAVKNAIMLIESVPESLVTFGILPSGAETGFGYIKSGERLFEGYRVDAFVEKPDTKLAEQYVTAGCYFWNSGMFCFSAAQILKQLALHAPEVAKTCNDCWNLMNGEASAELSILEIPKELFDHVPDISIDYAVMEHSKQIAVVTGDIGWTDIGSWNAIRDLVKPDGQGNRALGDAIFVNSNNVFVQSEDRLVASVGLDNLMIIDTVDALLVANPAHAQEVKQVVNALKLKNHESCRIHKTVMRPWGTYTNLQEAPGFKIKRIEVNPGASLSLQLHYHRSEHWIVVQGNAVIVNGDDILYLHPNESTYIPAGHKHRLENRTDQALVLIEVQCGSYLGEDDIVRFEDHYGRVN